MTRSSIKKLFRSILAAPLLSAASVTAATPPAKSGFSTSYKITAESRLAYHLIEPRDLASHRHVLDVEQDVTFDPTWTAVLGLRAYAEAAFAVNDSRYGTETRRNESSDIRLRDFYLQYKNRKLLVRVGNQQVVWGEAFGFYYADIINPKDLRDFGLRDLTAQRLMMPLASAILFFKDASLALVYGPKPYFNLVPSIDSEFSPWQRLFPGTPLHFVDRGHGPAYWLNPEFGLRLTNLWHGYDLGFFFFSYFDRDPTYTSVPNGAGLDLVASHNRIGSLGFTFTKDFSPWLIRWESLFTKDKLFQKMGASGLSGYTGHEITAAMEVEYTGWLPWRVALQLAYQGIPSFDPASLTPRHRTQLSGNVKAPIWREHSLDAILTWALHDGSSLARLQYTIPTSQQFEVMVGGDLLFGGANSQFGGFHNASRFYVQLKGYLAK